MPSKRCSIVETTWEDLNTGLIKRERRMQEDLADDVDDLRDREPVDPSWNILDTGKSRRRRRTRRVTRSGVDEISDSESVDRNWDLFREGKTQGKRRTQKPPLDKVEETTDQEPTDMNWHRGTGKTKCNSPTHKVILNETDEMRNQQTGDFDKPRSPTYSAMRFARGGPHATGQQSSPSVSRSTHGKTGRTPAVGQNAVSSSPSHSRHEGVPVMDQSDPFCSQSRPHRKECPATGPGTTSHSQSHFDRSRKHPAMDQRARSPSRHPIHRASSAKAQSAPPHSRHSIPKAPLATSQGNPAPYPPRPDREEPPKTGPSDPRGPDQAGRRASNNDCQEATDQQGSEHHRNDSKADSSADRPRRRRRRSRQRSGTRPQAAPSKEYRWFICDLMLFFIKRNMR